MFDLEVGVLYWVFFGAFIPQFMDMSKDHISQVALLGFTFMVTGAVTDSIYAILAGRARRFFSARRTKMLSRVSGGLMIGGGIWLALTQHDDFAAFLSRNPGGVDALTAHLVDVAMTYR